MSRRLRRCAGRSGFTLVELLVVIAIIGTLVGLLLPAVQNAREAARSNHCRSNLTQLQKAMAMYETNNEEYPGYVNPIGSLAATTKASWGAMMLPFIEQQQLWEKYEQGTAAAAAIELYICPSNPPSYENGPSMSYVANAGWFQDEKIDEEGDNCAMTENPANGVFFDRTRSLGSADARDLDPECQQPQSDPIPIVKFASIQAKGDGSTNVLMFAESVNAAAWTYTSSSPPDKKWHFGFCWEQPHLVQDALASPATDLVEWGAQYRILNGARETFDLIDVGTKPPNSGVASSFHPGGVNVAFVGGQVIFLRDKIDPFVFAQLMTSNHKRSDLVVRQGTGGLAKLVPERNFPAPDSDDY